MFLYKKEKVDSDLDGGNLDSCFEKKNEFEYQEESDQCSING